MASRIGASYWCYRCDQFNRVRIGEEGALLCADCGAGFIEEIRNAYHFPFHRLPPAAMSIDDDSQSSQSTSPRVHRSRRNGGDRLPFNPVIVLRGPADGGGGGGGNEGGGAERGNFELYYNEGAGSGLRPLPAGVTEFLMGSGFDHLLDQLAQPEVTGIGRLDRPPASKAAIESMPVIKIAATHVSADWQCAVCMEPFEIDSDAREMPCKHIYHCDCILSWLSIRNSCPVCRHELPTELQGNSSSRNSPLSDGGRDDDTVGLTIWRLPGGGFAVGRLAGGRRAAEQELPVVYTEMDGGFNNAGVPRRISWESSVRNSREIRGWGSAFRSFFSSLGRFRTSFSRSSGTNSGMSRRLRLNAVLSRLSRRRS